MIWLASYPRSGNTFFRIVLDEAFAVKSIKFRRPTGKPTDPTYTDYQVVKTHGLPSELAPADPAIPAVYLVRDGRDCAVSMARRHKDFVDTASDYGMNLRETIIGPGGDHAGFWSEHVQLWQARSSLVFRFEEVISDPVDCIEKLRPYIDLPEAQRDKVPTFQDLKTRDFAYGAGKSQNLSEEEAEQARGKFFRRGKAGGWKEEMPEFHQRMFWRFHGPTLMQLGYQAEEDENLARKRILIDVSALPASEKQGLVKTLQNLSAALESSSRGWQVDVLLGAKEVCELAKVSDESLTRNSGGFLSKILRSGGSDAPDIDLDEYDLVHVTAVSNQEMFKAARTKRLVADLPADPAVILKLYENAIYREFIERGLYPFAATSTPKA